jgi:small-conductance mechanosensitive channel
MIKKTTITCAFICLLFAHRNLFAQQDGSPAKSDSLTEVVLSNYYNKLTEIEHRRRADSIRKLELQTQLQSLSIDDSIRKHALQKEIEQLEVQAIRLLAQNQVQTDSLHLLIKGYPITGFFNDTLFYIYNRLGSFSAKERAESVTARIKKLGDDLTFEQSALIAIEAETTVDLFKDSKIIISVSDNDALFNNTTKIELANRYKNIIADEVMKYKSTTSYIVLAKEVGLAILVLLTIGLLIFYISKLFKYNAKRIILEQDKRLKGIKLKNYTLFDSGREVRVLLTVNRIFKWLIILLAIYITLPVLFSIFPWTRNFSGLLFGFILNPVKKIAFGFWNYLPNLITVIVIVLFFHYVLKGVYFLKEEIEKEHLKVAGFYPDWAQPTYQIFKILIFAFMIVIIFPYLPGSNSPIFKGVSVFLGFLITFGSAGSLSNIVAGLILTYMRLFKIGDRVKIGDVTGDVIEKNSLVTRVRTIKNEIISIPNSTVMSSHTTNYSSDAPDKGLIIYTTITIGYNVPWRDMHLALIDAALRTELILHEPAPFVLQVSLDDSYVSYQINAYIRDANEQPNIYSRLHQNIQDVCNERGIEILSPEYRAGRDGNRTTIPDKSALKL